ERYDGRGYPDGLAGEDNPPLARIFAVADAYDALSHPRPYRDALPHPPVEEGVVARAGNPRGKQGGEAICRCLPPNYATLQRSACDSLRLAIDGALRSVSAPRRSAGEPEHAP